MRESEPVREGDPLLLPFEGGPSQARLEHFPPRVEIDERGGTYVLVDEGEPHEWRYVFVPDER